MTEGNQFREATKKTDNAKDRTCETCVYCSFGGYCDEYGMHELGVPIGVIDK